MDIYVFIQESLKITWVVFLSSFLILVLGWVVGKLLAKWVVSLFNRTPIIEYAVKRLKLPNSKPIDQGIRQLTRVLVILLALWVAWKNLNVHPEISGFILTGWQSIINFVELPAVHLILNLLLIGLATFILLKVIGWVKVGFTVLTSRIAAEKGKSLKGFKFQRVQVFTARQLTSFLLGVSKYIRYAVNILLFLIYLTAIFSVFPQTRGVVTSGLESVFKVITIGWLDFIDYLPSLLNLVLVIFVTFYGLKLIRFIFGEIEKGTIKFSGFHAEWAAPTYQLVRVAIFALALVVAFPFLPGSSSPAFQGISVFIGILFSLGSTSFVANIVAGVVLTYTRAFHIGDRVKIADNVGDIIEKSLLVTRLRTIKNVEVTIPNSMVMGSHIINYSVVAQDRKLILNTTVTLGYDISWRLIHETLIKAAQATKDILTDPRPFVLQTSLDDSYVSYEINAYTDQPNKMANIYSELHQNIQDFCNKAGIEILSPKYGALRDGNPSTMPSEYLHKDYKAPSFQVSMSQEKKRPSNRGK